MSCYILISIACSDNIVLKYSNLKYHCLAAFLAVAASSGQRRPLIRPEAQAEERARLQEIVREASRRVWILADAWKRPNGEGHLTQPIRIQGSTPSSRHAGIYDLL